MCMLNDQQQILNQQMEEDRQTSDRIQSFQFCRLLKSSIMSTSAITTSAITILAADSFQPLSRKDGVSMVFINDLEVQIFR